MNADVLIRQKEGPLFTRVDDELVGVDTQAGLTYGLNRSAARVWELLADWTTVDAVCAQLEREFAVERQSCAAHVEKLVARLTEAGLVEQRRSGTR